MTNSDDAVTSPEVGYAIEIGDSLHKKIDTHIKALSLDDRNHSKQSWIIEAIKEKLSTEKQNAFKMLSKGKFLNLSMSKKLMQEVEEKVTAHKAIRKSYSKKKWILEAIYEKFDKEEKLADQLMEQFKNTLKNDR